MQETVRTVMTPDPVCVTAGTPVATVAQEMRDRGIGDVLVVDRDVVRGVVTDRDIVVRAVAELRDPVQTPIAALATTGVVSIAPDAPISEAVRLMRQYSVRRLPVVNPVDGKPVGVVSLGDLALDRDPHSTLADISAAPPNI